MALFPQGLSHVDARCTGGERRVLHQLKRCLEDDYIVWHDIAIGAKARQPDFVILSPRDKPAGGAGPRPDRGAPRPRGTATPKPAR